MSTFDAPTYQHEYCSHEFKWTAHLGNKMSNTRGTATIFSFAKDAVIASSRPYKDGASFKITCRCPNCDKLLQFDFTTP